MRKSASTVAVIGTAAVLALSACGSSSNNSSNPPKSGGTGGSPQIGVILPDTTTSTRYTLYDQPLLTKAFAAAGIKADIQNAQGSNSKFSQIADSMTRESRSW
jgi:D-xylose transport system substrate-binding protein